MARRFFTVAAALALFALPLAAQPGVAGKRNANVDTPNGPFALVFEFIVGAAGKLTGSLQNELFGSIPIQDGTIKASKFEGEVPGGGPAEQSFKATRAK